VFGAVHQNVALGVEKSATYIFTVLITATFVLFVAKRLVHVACTNTNLIETTAIRCAGVSTVFCFSL